MCHWHHFTIHHVKQRHDVYFCDVTEQNSDVPSQFDTASQERILLSIENLLEMSVSQSRLSFVLVSKYRESLDTPRKL